MLLQVISSFWTIIYVSLTQFKEDNAVLSDYNHSQAVVINLEVISSSKQIRGHSQCHCHYTRGHTSNFEAYDNSFHAHSSREAIAQCCARIEQDRFGRDLAYNSGGSRLLARGQKFRLFHQNSKNGFSLIFDRLKHSFATKTVPRTRADHYNVQLVAEDGFNPGTCEKLLKISLNIMSAKDITKSAATGVNKLDRTNYLQWTIDVQLLLEEKELWKFARDKQVEPLATASAAERDKYKKDKNKSRAIVLQCLVPRLQPAAMKHDTTEAVWAHLKKIFEPSSIAREASLVEEFYSMRRHENEELDSFMARLDKAEDDMVAANDKLKPEGHIKAYLMISRIGKEFEHQIQSIYQWKKGEFTYDNVRTALLAESNRRRLVETSDKNLEAATAYASSLKGQSVKSEVNSANSSDRAYLQSIVCFNCGTNGHFARDCAKPKAQRGGQQPRGRSRGRGRRQGRRAPNLAPESQMTKQAWFAKAAGKPAVIQAPRACSANIQNGKMEWFLDTCVSHHVCGDRNLFCEFEELKPMKLELGEGSSSITGRGTVELSVKIKNVVNVISLESVYYVKGFKRNLISVGKIDQAKFNVHIYNNCLKVYKSDSKICSLYGKLDDWLYKVQGPVQFRSANLGSSFDAKSNVNLTKPENCCSETGSMGKFESHAVSVHVWHQRIAVPNKPGWEREEVQRQSGATKGQWDIYFYAPGRRFPLRSRPEIREYCEKTLNVPYNPDEFSWKPTEAPIDTVSPVDTDNEGETQTMTRENDNADSDTECYTVRVYLAEVKEPSTFEEAMASPEKDEC
uniref:CCHC-type domain-containing protein n=1 Tax=Strigamia maritima TaxID=126957 RepID=T1IY94_STRMM